MFYFYVLYSLKDQKLYKGISEDVGRRFFQHNNGQVKSTKYRRPFVLIHIERFDTNTEAVRREKAAKSLEGGAALKTLLVVKGILDKDKLLKR